MSDSVRPHRWQPTRFPCPWHSPGKNTGVSCHFLLQCMKVKSESEVAQSCPTSNDPMDCSPPGPSVHGILQAGVLEWGAIAFSMYGEMQNCRLMEIIALICTSAIWGQHSKLSHFESPSVQFSRSVISDSLQPHGLQHDRPPCPSPTSRVYPNSCPLIW